MAIYPNNRATSSTSSVRARVSTLFLVAWTTFALTVMSSVALASSDSEDPSAKAATPTYPFWGVILQSHYSNQFREKYDFSYRGILVNAIVHNSPAELSRLHPCDEITHIDGIRFDSTDEMIAYVHSQPAEHYFEVTLWREGNEIQVESFIRYFDPNRGSARSFSNANRQSYGQDRCDFEAHLRLPETIHR
ncbi:PDZ domain-containing protein [Corallincola platygyrae]|uniref:PDZ domain-containing protein n=1 Tax=Corallincola platygyrae TaxID=1193278 RepID=A0ABW4XM26_9GAMM